MKTPPRLAFSIDLDAELKKIAQKQYLNDVHYLVQLVRHALALQAKRIEITSTKKEILLRQNGDNISPSEWRFLQVLLLNPSAGWVEKQPALSQLEEQFGTALLSLFLNFGEVECVTGQMAMISKGGRVGVVRAAKAVEGYRIRITRRGSKRDELRELTFFCSGVRVPIIFNGVAINQPIEFDGQMFFSRFQSSQGEGVVGIPSEGEMCALAFYKQGVRLGTKQFIPPDGRQIHGYWNSFLGHFESQYSETIRIGEQFLFRQGEQLYRALPNHLHEFDPQQRARIKKIMMAMDQKLWMREFQTLPVFHSCGGDYELSLKDILSMSRRYESVPFCASRHKQCPAHLPLLNPEDIFFLRNGCRLKLRLFHPRNSQNQALLQRQHNPNDSALELMNLIPWQRRLLEVLNRDGGNLVFHFVDGPSHVSSQADGTIQVFLFRDLPLVRQLDHLLLNHGEKLSLVKYLLLGEAERGSVG